MQPDTAGYEVGDQGEPGITTRWMRKVSLNEINMLGGEPNPGQLALGLKTVQRNPRGLVFNFAEKS